MEGMALELFRGDPAVSQERISFTVDGSRGFVGGAPIERNWWLSDRTATITRMLVRSWIISIVMIFEWTLKPYSGYAGTLVAPMTPLDGGGQDAPANRLYLLHTVNPGVHAH